MKTGGILMSSLYAFLNPTPICESKEVIVSDRFKNEDGTIRPFKIKQLTQEDNERIARKCKRPKKKNGNVSMEFDEILYSQNIILESVIEPDFRNAELCEHYGTLNPLEVPSKMLTVQEYSVLSNAILQDLEENNLYEEAKN